MRCNKERKKNCRTVLGLCSAILLLLIDVPVTAQDTSYGDDIASLMEAKGLVDIRDVDPRILLDIRYSTTDNFTGVDLYGTFDCAYLQPHMAEKLKKAQDILMQEGYAHLRIIIFDGARPQSAQRRMYKLVQGTPNKVYVAHPANGGRHNFGVAVDLSLYDERLDCELDMGTPFDFFGVEAHVDNEEALVRRGVLSHEAVENRRLLRNVMKRVGLRPYRREWWHFEEPMPINSVRSKYQLLNF